MARTGNNYEKWLMVITQLIYKVGLWFLGSALPLIVIYLYTKSYLDANSSFKDICRTKYCMDGQTKQRLYASTFGEHKNVYLINQSMILFLIELCKYPQLKKQTLDYKRN